MLATFLRCGSWQLPFLALVVIHLLSGLQMEQPLILADELGYLGNARYLAGAAHLPDMRETQFIHFGYSLFLLPAFWLFADPVSSYKAAITTNALLASCLYFPLCFILVSFLDVPKGLARWIAFTCCLYPPLILYSSFAWSENAFITLYAVATALFGKYLASTSSRGALLFGLLAGFLFTIHPRALPVLAIVLVVLVLLAVLKIAPVGHVVLSASAIGLIFTLTRVINGHLRAEGWGSAGAYSAARQAGRLVPGSDFPLLMERASGQALYLSLASHWLVPVAVVALIWRLHRRMASGSPRRLLADPKTGVPLFVLITASGIFLASCAVKLYSIHGPDGLRGADFIHGRYNEAFAVLFTAFALAEYCRERLQWRQQVRLALGVAAAIFCLTAIVATEIEAAQGRQVASVPGAIPADKVLPAQVEGVNVPGVYPLIVVLGAMDLYRMYLVAMASFLIITGALRRSPRAGMVTLMLLFSSFSLYNHRRYTSPAKARAEPRLRFVAQVSRLGPIRAISYDVAHEVAEVHHGTQYLLPHVVFDRFDSRKGEEPKSEAVISGNEWTQAESLGARFVVSSGWDNAMWVLPGRLESRLPSSSYEGVILGAEPAFGVQESGFHLPERFGDEPRRWTNGAATLRVPLDPQNPPRLLGIQTIVPGRDVAQLRVLANGVELCNESVPAERWTKTFSLDQVPLEHQLVIELSSDTFSPNERRLGVGVTWIRLTTRDSRAAAREGSRLGASYTLGVEESGFHRDKEIAGAPGRWTNGAATLKVPLDPQAPPQLLEIETAAPGRDGVELQVLANGIELWNERIPAGVWSKTLDLEGVPVQDTLLIALNSDTFVPAERRWWVRDLRRLGVGVRAVRLKARDAPGAPSSTPY